MHPLIAELVVAAPILTDGAWGTQLQALGLPAGGCADEWNLTFPDRVEQVARSYVDAGSRVILTNTFRANSIALAAKGLADQAAEINRAGVDISRRAGAGRALVFASIGPSGKLLLTGEVKEPELRDTFAAQARALADAGAHALVIETMADLNEATIALSAARETGLPVVVCMVFDSGKARDRTMMGATPEQVAERLTAAGADVIGANCGQGIAGYVEVCRRLRAATDRPVWIKANAGLPEIVDGEIVYRITPAEFAADALRVRDAGAAFIGGCCGTSPPFIRAVAAALR
ncbi:MAG: homocysteine S-methyltransferase family protein [Gemmataceae bacterium]